MRKIILNFKYLVIGFAALTLSSCDSLLDQEPISQLGEENFWKTPEDAVAGTAAIYDGMQKTYNNQFLLWGEFRGDNYILSSLAVGDNASLVTNTIAPSFNAALNWTNLYRMIGRANLAIERIPLISGADQNLLAEAYAARAFAYFDAIRVWGDVPLYTASVSGLSPEIYKPRTDATKILNEVIIPDMLNAERLMTKNIDTYRFSKASVWLLQAEVYFWIKDFAKAKIVLDKVEALKAYSLVTTRDAWQKLFLNDVGAFGQKFMTGPELMFSIRYNLTEDNDRSGIFGVAFAGIPSFYISPALETKWTTKFPLDSIGWYARYPGQKPKATTSTGSVYYGDWRYEDSKEAGRPLGLARVAKYTKININPSFDDTDLHVYRYAGFVLLQAEVENQLGNTTAALALINRVRAARQLPNVVASEFKNKAELENIILDERQMELLCEGKRWWDLRRTGKAIEVMAPLNGQTEQKLLWPIWTNHIIDNPKLTQNPGY